VLAEGDVLAENVRNYVEASGNAPFPTLNPDLLRGDRVLTDREVIEWLHRAQGD
jgi:hypothetical protein